jgi:hypothetical protein
MTLNIYSRSTAWCLGNFTLCTSAVKRQIKPVRKINFNTVLLDRFENSLEWGHMKRTRDISLLTDNVHVTLFLFRNNVTVKEKVHRRTMLEDKY